MSLLVKNAQNQTETLRTVDTGSGHAPYHNELGPWFLRAARGDETGVSLVHVWGKNSGVHFGVDEDVWTLGDTIVNPSAETTLNIVSDSSSDDSASTGAQTLYIEGVDGNHAATSETITMDGTVTVVSTNSYLRLNKVEVATWGTGGQNVGTITVGTSGSPSDTLAQVLPGDNRHYGTHFTVPASTTAYLRTFFGTVESGITLRYTLLSAASATNQGFVPRAGLKIYQGMETHPFEMFEVQFTEKTDVVVRAQRVDTSGVTPAEAGFSLLLVGDSLILG
jgi:hypothetical protein